jgi:hypothetical protein
VFEAQLLARREIDANGCWVWTGYIGKGGYGAAYLWWGNWCRTILVHRAAYLLWKGAIGDSLEVDHRCHNRACFNPDHLEAVTRSVNNSRRRWMRNQYYRVTHCKWGHPYDEANTRHEKNGNRVCHQCSLERGRRYRKKKRQERGETTPSKPVGQSLKTHCKRGHEFNKQNTYVWETKTGIARLCRECRRDHQQRLRDSRRPE